MIKKTISSVEMFILICGIFAFAYIINPRELLPRVSAGTIPPSCCLQKNDGARCAVVTNDSECASGLSYGSTCTFIQNCQTGCCYNESLGIYDNGVAQQDCHASFVQGDSLCASLNEAKRGCCVVNSENFYINQRQCELRTPRGVELNWTDELNEAQCGILQLFINEGACVVNNWDGSKGCRMITRSECLAVTGSETNFYDGYLCTSKELNTTCKKSPKTSCFPGKDEVYFLDSCMNRANIYDSSKYNDDLYWEKLILKNNSCGFKSASGNAGSSTCGNCNRFTGGICALKTTAKANPPYGDYACKSVNCVYNGKTYKNGESWCEYDSDIGEGRDVPGALHWKYVCNQGDVRIERCADYRNEICVQKDMFELNNQQVKFSNANCVQNLGMGCLFLNNEEGDMTECAKTDFCMVKTIHFDNFTQNFCLPQYPVGFDMQSETEVSGAEGVCGIGSKVCIVKYKVTYDCHGKIVGKKCAENCECLGQEFTDQMNDVCKSLGDCGGEFNVAGKYTKNFKIINGTENISSAAFAKLKSYATPVPGKYAAPPNMSGIIDALLPNSAQTIPASGLPTTGASEDEDDGGFLGMDLEGMLWPVGLGGLIASLTTNKFVSGSSLNWANLFSMGGKDAKLGSAGFVGLGRAIVGGAIGYFVGGYLAETLGYTEGSEAYQMAVYGTALLGVLAGSGMLNVMWNSATGIPGSGGWGWTRGTMWGGIASIVIIVTIVVLIFGGAMGLFGDDEDEECGTQTIDGYEPTIFLCKPWLPPVGGKDCESCNSNQLHPGRSCTEYKCHSLGTACKILNKGTDHEICDNAGQDDVNPPVLTETINADANIRYSRSGNNIEISGRSGGCLDPYETYLIGIRTDEPGQCKYDFVPRDNFEALQFDFGAGYVYNHITSIMIPNPNIFQNWNGKLTLYVKCRDVQGNPSPLGNDFFKINMCVNPARDMTPPTIRFTIPANGSYVKLNATESKLKVILNEPAECRYSRDSKFFDLMENNMSCTTALGQIDSSGYNCNVTIPTPDKKNTYFIRCKDQPWLAGKNDSLRNSNFESTELTLLKADSPIEISSVAPNSDFETTSLNTVITLKALTSGGAGNATCFYSFSGYENMLQFLKNEEELHEQVFDVGLSPGNYRIYVKCDDVTGDFTQREVRFKIIYDANPTEVARIFAQSGSLKIITSKDRECRYSTDSDVKCDFSFQAGTPMGISKDHTISFDKGKIYYIKCSNKFGEVPRGCTEIVKVV